jgi:general secretion pathway protein G
MAELKKKLGASGYPENLEILVRGVENQRDPNRQKIYFLRRVPLDPFMPAPNSLEEGNWGKRSYTSEADTPEEGDDLYDIYSLSVLTGLNGVPYKKW